MSNKPLTNAELRQWAKETWEKVCPDCERHKASASRWRNEAYRLGGTPLPWSPDEALLRQALEALEYINSQYAILADHEDPVEDAVAALKARLGEKK